MEKFMCKLTFSGIEGKGLYTYVGLIYVATVVLNFLVATKIVGCAPAEDSDDVHPLEQQQLSSWAAAILNLLTVLLSTLYYVEVKEHYPMFGYLNKILFIACGAFGFLFAAVTYGYTKDIALSCSTIENSDELRIESVWAVYLNIFTLAIAHMGKKSEYMPVSDAASQPASVGIDVGDDNKLKSNYRGTPDLRF